METLASIHHAESYETTQRQPSPLSQKATSKVSRTVAKAKPTRSSGKSASPKSSGADMQGWVMPWMP